MDGTSKSESRALVWLDRDAGDFEQFRTIVGQTTQAADWPYATEIIRNVLIYRGDEMRTAATRPETRRAWMAEWAHAFASGPGLIVIRDAIPDHDVVDRGTSVMGDLIEAERASGGGGGDHFAKPGANDRLWNAVEKHCLAAPSNFADYYATDALAMASEAWLGQGYQVTAQVNRVNPGGAAQTPHRDYHLGFMSAEDLAGFPAHVHGVSPCLTLQGAIAHCDMPLESGPTVFLPYSQQFFEGYVAFGQPAYQDHFAEHHVQLQLSKGDAIFFNPALMHGAGENRSADTLRMANLVQVSSAFGRAIETVNRTRMSIALYPALLDSLNQRDPRAVSNAIAACAEGYAYPTNLDRDLPVDGLAPLTQARLMKNALENGLPTADFAELMAGWEQRRDA